MAQSVKALEKFHYSEGLMIESEAQKLFSFSILSIKETLKCVFTIILSLQIWIQIFFSSNLGCSPFKYIMYKHIQTYKTESTVLLHIISSAFLLKYLHYMLSCDIYIIFLCDVSILTDPAIGWSYFCVFLVREWRLLPVLSEDIIT